MSFSRFGFLYGSLRLQKVSAKTKEDQIGSSPTPCMSKSEEWFAVRLLHVTKPVSDLGWTVCVCVLDVQYVCSCAGICMCAFRAICVITMFHSKTIWLALSFSFFSVFFFSFPREALPLLLQSHMNPANTRWSEMYALYMLIVETVTPWGCSYPSSLLKRNGS